MMPKYKNINHVHTDKCRGLVERLQICDIVFAEGITKKFHLDFYGWNADTGIIIEYKPTAEEVPKAIVQLLGYYKEITREKSLTKFKFRIPKEIKLIIYYDGSDTTTFNKAIALYRDYIANPNCPQIFFVCHGENDKLEIT